MHLTLPFRCFFRRCSHMTVKDDQKKVVQARDLGLKSKADQGGATKDMFAEVEANPDGGDGELQRSEERTKKKDDGGGKLKKSKTIYQGDSDDDFVAVKLQPTKTMDQGRSEEITNKKDDDNFAQIKNKRHKKRKKMEPNNKFAVAGSGVVDMTPLGHRGYGHQSVQGERDVQRVGDKQDTVGEAKVEVVFYVYGM